MAPPSCAGPELTASRQFLVSVRAEDGFIWLSSTTREDSGDGACEVVLAEDIEYF